MFNIKKERARMLQEAVRPVAELLAESPEYQECSMVAFAIGYNRDTNEFSITLVTNNPGALLELLELAKTKATRNQTAIIEEKPHAPKRIVH